MNIDNSTLGILSKAQGFKAVMIGTIILLGGTTGITAKLLDTKFIAGDVLSQRVVVAAVAALLLVGMWIALRWQKLLRHSFKSKHVFVAFPSLDNEPFHVDVLRGVVATLTPEFSVTLWLPQTGSEYKGSAFEEFLAMTKRDSALYVGGIVLPTVVDHSKPARLANLIEKIALPVVIVDTLPDAFLKDGRLSAGQQFVGYSNVTGGKQAAEALRNELTKIGRRPKNILVLHAKEQTDRQESFMLAFKSMCPDVQFDLAECGWQRSRARDAVNDRINAGAIGRYDGIFGCNDEMAVGAVEALARWSADKPEDQRPVVIGYDGSPTALALMEIGTTPLRNLVIQDGYNLGAEAATRLRRSLKLAESEDDAEPVLPQLLDTKLYRPYLQ